MAKDYTVLRSGEWSALYIDGELNIYWDHFLFYVRLYSLLDINVEDSDDWLGKDNRTALNTLAEVEEVRKVKETAQARIEQLEEEIARLRQL